MRSLPAPRLTRPVSQRDHIRGPADAPVTLVEYGDYECPYCGEAYPVVEEIRRAMGNRLRFVFRHFPLSQMHPHAQDAAEAAEAAGALHKFWEMHDTLYTHQEALDESDLLRYAVALGLDPLPVRKALEEDAYLDRVREDFISGARSGVNGTPSFFIEGVRYDGPHDFDSMLAVLVEAAEKDTP
jgi:protein-disulfide isomerase